MANNSFFTDKKVAKSYEAVFGIDKLISVPGFYTGKLSGINVETAEEMIRLGDNQVVKKTTPPPQVPEPPKE